MRQVPTVSFFVSVIILCLLVCGSVLSWAMPPEKQEVTQSVPLSNPYGSLPFPPDDLQDEKGLIQEQKDLAKKIATRVPQFIAQQLKPLEQQIADTIAALQKATSDKRTMAQHRLGQQYLQLAEVYDTLEGHCTDLASVLRWLKRRGLTFVTPETMCIDLHPNEQAVLALQQAASILSNDARLQEKLGDAFTDHEKWSEATDAYEKARVQKRDSKLFTKLRLAYEEQGRWHEAALAEFHAIEREPHQWRSYWHFLSQLDYGQKYDGHPLWVNLEEHGDWHEAAKLYQQLTQRLPKDSLAHVSLGQIYVRLRDWPKAIATCKKAVRLDNKNPQAYFCLGDAYSGDTNNWQDAAATYQHVLHFTPNSNDAHVSLHKAFARRRLRLSGFTTPVRRWQEFIDFYRDFAKQWPQVAAGYVYLAHGYYHAHQWAEAAQTYKAAIALDPTPELYLWLAEALANAGSATEAETILTEALQYTKTEDVSSLEKLADLSLQLNAWAFNAEVLKRLCQLEPTDMSHYVGLGNALIQLGKKEEAIAKYTTVIQHQPADTAEAYLDLGYAYQALGRADEALAALKHAYKLDPANNLSWRLAASIFRSNHHWSEAENWLNDMQQRLPKAAFVFIERGKIYAHQGRGEDAVRDLEQAVTLEPDNARAQAELSIFYSKFGPRQKALSAAEKAHALDPLANESVEALARAYLGQGDTEKADAVLNQVLTQLPPTDRLAHEVLANTCYRLQAFDCAARAREQITKLTPNDPAAYVNYGDALTQLQRLDEATQAYTRATQVPMPETAEGYNQLGDAYAALGKYDKAIDAYKQGIQRDSRYIFLYFALARLYTRHEKWGDAIATYKSILAISTSEPVVHARLAEIYAEQYKWEQTVAEYEQSIKLNPDQPTLLVDLAIAYALVNANNKAAHTLALASRKGEISNYVLDLIDLFFSAGRYLELTALMEVWLQVAQELGDPKDFLITASEFSIWYEMLGDQDAARNIVERALAPYTDVNVSATDPELLEILGDLCHLQPELWGTDNRTPCRDNSIIPLYERAFKLYGDNGKSERQTSVMRALYDAYTVKFDVAHAESDRQQAITWGEKLVRVTESSLSTGIHIDIKSAEVSLGMSYLKTRNYDRAKEFCEKARGRVDSFQTAPFSVFRNWSPMSNAYPYLCLGLTYEEKGEFSEALSMAEETAKLVRKAGQNNSTFPILTDLQQKAQFEVQHKWIPRLLLKQRQDQATLEKAFTQYESGRAVKLRTRLTAVEIYAQSGSPDLRDLLKQEDKLRNRIRRLSREVKAAEFATATSDQNPESSPTVISKLGAGLLRLQYQLDYVQRKIKDQEKKEPPSVNAPPSVSIAEVKHALPEDDQSVFLEYLITGDSSFVWAITKHEATIHRLPSGDVIERLVALYINNGASLNTLGDRDHPFPFPWEESRSHVTHVDPSTGLPPTAPYAGRVVGEALFEALLGPIADLIQNKRLIIVQDNILYYFPFESLCLPTSCPTSELPAPPLRFLGLTHEISYAPSAAAWVLMKNRRKFFPPLPPEPGKELLMVGAPPYEENGNLPNRLVAAVRGFFVSQPDQLPVRSVRSAYETRREKPLHNLPYAHFQAQQRRKQYRLSNTCAPVCTGNAATEEQVRALAPLGYRIQEYALHATRSNESLRLTQPALLFSLLRFPFNPDFDNILELDEIYALNIAADLVLLPNCWSAAGENVASEGPLSLARAFLNNGTNTVGAALWEVDDESIARLMGYFHEHLQNGRTKVEAIQQARNDLIKKHPQFANPSHWAAFILIGTET